VAQYQETGSGEDAINPFVVDSSLAARAFYPETLPTADELPTTAETPLRLELAGPNPFRDLTALVLTLASFTRTRIEAYDMLEQAVAVLYDGTSGGRSLIIVDGAAWPFGTYLLRVTTESGVATNTLP
jgi:hypothetical protein